MFAFAKNSIWDFLLCVAVSAALCFTACGGYASTVGFQSPMGVVAIIAICAIITLALFASSYSTQTMLFGGIGIGLVLVIAIVASVATSTTSTALEDADGNNFYFALSVILPTLLVFALSRWRISTVILLVAGVFFCALLEYLYWKGHIVAFAVFLAGTVALLAYRTYAKSLANSESERLAFGAVTASGLALALATTLLAGGVFALVIGPLNPPNVIVKLITEHYKANEVEVKGIGSTMSVQNNRLYSNTLSEETVQSSELSNTNTQQNNNNVAQGNDSIVTISNVNMDVEEDQDKGLAGWLMSLDFPNWLPYVIAGVLVALIAGSILAKKLLRRRAYANMIAGNNDSAVNSLYLFFLKRFDRFKIPQPGSLTLSEYADGFAGTFSEFEQRIDNPEFSKLTQIYAREVYGGGSATDEECSAFKSYYDSFYKNARNYVGSLRYCRLFFFI